VRSRSTRCSWSPSRTRARACPRWARATSGIRPPVRVESGRGPWRSPCSERPSGVCSMAAIVNTAEVPGPSATPNTDEWQQCPDPTWTPAAGASVDTRDYVPGAGQLSLTLEASNAAGVYSQPSETLEVDNEPVGVTLSTPNDSNPSLWVNHAVTVDAATNAGPSGIGGRTAASTAARPRRTPQRGSRSTAVGCTACRVRPGTTRSIRKAARTRERPPPRSTSTRRRRAWRSSPRIQRPDPARGRHRRQPVRSGRRIDRDGAGGHPELDQPPDDV